MIDIDQLDERFSIEGEVGFAALEYELVFITVSNKFADADICLYGAHVTSFRPHHTMDILWMSPQSNFQVGFPIRGGIPVCFPWFGPHKTDPGKPMHGFARLMYWDVAETASLPNGETLVRLQLCSSDETKAYWPYDFCAEMNITVGRTLTTTLKVTNTSGGPFDYSGALHSYFNLSLIDNISIAGLQNTAYHNQLDGSDGFQETEKLQILQPETRHYFNTETASVIEDPVFRRKIRVEKSGSRVTTVWNPGEETCSKMADLPDDGYLTFVCVETVNAFEDTIHLGQGESHETMAVIGLEEQ
ncbi:MAG: D-hexose-6-phosphate mutarotase [Prolixibacteraceae bacterium]|jgi:glucose-6-phosphate 1-epimerase|nr:D-hexose-6-phosphate mutarotase [Prolixibacteraceae bacterium]